MCIWKAGMVFTREIQFNLMRGTEMFRFVDKRARKFRVGFANERKTVLHWEVHGDFIV